MPTSENPSVTDALDYSRSVMMWDAPYNPNDDRKPGHMPWGNSARIQFDARCELSNSRLGEAGGIFPHHAVSNRVDVPLRHLISDPELRILRRLVQK